MKHINANHNTGIRRQTMLVRMFTAMLMLLIALPVCAQKGLGVDEVFRRFGHERGSKMVEMNNTSLMGYRLKVYKSLIYRKNAAEIEAILKGDRRQAKKIREVVEDGRVVSGYYMMTPAAKNVNRYILFSKSGGGRGTVIYIEGDLSPDDIMKMCYSRK